MLQNPNPFVKTKTHKQPKQQKERDSQNKEQQQPSEHEEHNSNITSDGESPRRDLTLEEQLDLFADLLIDLYFLDQQPTRHEEN